MLFWKIILTTDKSIRAEMIEIMILTTCLDTSYSVIVRVSLVLKRTVVGD